MKKNAGPGKTDSELRKHYFLDRYVIIAPKRNLRPGDIGIRNIEHTTETATTPAIELDPAVLEIKDTSDHWLVKVVNNKFPALTLDNPRAYGKQEVVIETPQHNVEFSGLPLIQIERIFSVYANRTASLRKLPGIRHVAVFKNDGPKAGASIAHAHSQIIAMPIVPPHLAHEAAAMTDYEAEYGNCAYCDVIKWEIKNKKRLLYNTDQILAYTPYASENPFEVWINPKRHVSCFAELTPKELHDIAVILKNVCVFLDGVKISFNFFLQDSIVGQEHHFTLKIEPRQTVWAGLELSTGVIINPVAPEEAAAWYRKSFHQIDMIRKTT